MATGNGEFPEGLFESQEEQTEVLRSISNESNEEERRHIREEYRAIQDYILENGHALINPGCEQDLLEKVDKLFKQVQRPREGALDASSLVNISELGKTKAQALKTDFVTFKPADFCDNVRIKLMGNYLDHSGLSHENWVTLGNAVQCYFKRTPVIRYMCGSFERGEVVLKKSRPAREKDKEKDTDKTATKPTQLSSFEETDRGELTTVQVEHLLDTLWRVYNEQNDSPICYFEFVTNPHSFGQTVENIFYTSFLVRDGHAKIYLDDDELPVIEPVERSHCESLNNANQTSHSNQVVLTITPEEWEEIVRVFQIEEPIIKELRTDVLRENNRSSNCFNGSQGSYEGKGKGKATKKAL